jgi:hypothetical protein
MAEVFNGVVASVGVFPIKEEIRTQKVTAPGKHFGKQFQLDKTHSIAIKVIGLKVNGVDYDKWISVRHQKFNEGQELSLRLETGGEWKDVWEGSKILFFYEINNGFVNIIDKGKMALMEQGPRPNKVYTFGTKENNSGNNNTSSNNSYDPKGMMKGNAFNCAMILVDYNSDDPRIHDLGCKIYDINCNIQKKFPKLNGASVGMSITNACHITKDVTTVESMAISLLNSYIKSIGDYVDGVVTKPETSSPKNVEPDPTLDDGMDDLPF